MAKKNTNFNTLKYFPSPTGSDPRAIQCLTNMMLCKILANLPGEVASLLSGKHGLKYAGPELTAMGAVAKASKNRSLQEFQKVVDTYGSILRADDLVSRRLDLLYDSMLEANLLKIINPYSCVEMSHVAKLIKLPDEQV